LRYQNWPERLSEIIERRLQKCFEWGEHDCCLFAADVVAALTGVDFGAELRGTYSTALEAARILKERGGVRGIASAALGAEIPPLMAQRGDIIMYRSANGEALGVCVGAQFVAAGTNALLRGGMDEALAAWRVK